MESLSNISWYLDNFTPKKSLYVNSMSPKGLYKFEHGYDPSHFLNNVKKGAILVGEGFPWVRLNCLVSCHCRKTDMQTKSGRERIFCARFPSVGFLLTTSHLKRDTWSIKSFYYSINTLFVEPQLDGILEKWVFEYVKDEYSTMLKIYHLVVHLNAFNSAISQGNWLLKD